MTKRRTHGRSTPRPPSTKQLVALLRARLGRKPPQTAIPGLPPTETYALYDGLCRAARALGIRY